MFKYTLDNKRYHTLNYYNKTKYGCKVFKVSLNAGFSCPNKKNGTGCIYCYNGSGENDGMDLLTQFNKVRDNITNGVNVNSVLYIGCSGENGLMLNILDIFRLALILMLMLILLKVNMNQY